MAGEEELDLMDAITAEAESLESGDNESEIDPETVSEEASEEEAVAEVSGEEEPSGESVSTEEVIAELLSAPEHWNQDYRDAFDKVDQVTQEQWLNQHKDFQRGFDDLSQQHKQYQEQMSGYTDVHKVIDQFSPMWQAQGMTAGAGVAQLAQWAYQLATNPQQTLPELARLYGVDLQSLGEEAPYVTTEDRQRDSRMQGLENRLQAQDRLLNEQQETQLIGQIESFRNETDADGTPIRPHFNAVMPAIQQMYESGFQGDLGAAYDQAIWTNPDVRQQMINGVQTETRTGDTQQRIADAKRAKAASGQRVKQTRPGESRNDTDDLELRDLVSHLAHKQSASG